MGLADIRATRQKTSHATFARRRRCPTPMRGRGRRLSRDAPGRTARARASRRATSPCSRRVHLRYAGTDTALVGRRSAALDAMKAAFEAAHRARFGFVDETKAARLRGARRRGGRRAAAPSRSLRGRAGGDAPRADARDTLLLAGRWHEPPSICADDLAPGHRVAGPALLIEPHQTVVVEAGWTAEITARDHVVLRAGRAASRAPRGRHRAPIR